jgi:osmoprotectant transport system ATP-binding protein
MDGEVSATDLVSGGSLYEVDSTGGGTAGSLRNALDAALSSPAAVGIAVDAGGAVVGGVTADTVLAALADARRAGEVPT